MTFRPPSPRLAGCFALLGLAACQQGEQLPPKPPAMVQTQTVSLVGYTPSVILTGEVRAQVQSELSFRVSGRIAERKVEVGAHVTADEVLATIDPQEQQANLNSAAATVQAAEAQLRLAVSTHDRQASLLAQGFTTRRESDQAEEAFRRAQASLDAANAQLATARDQLSFTVLRAGASGIITARNAEAGQVVQAAQSVFSFAQDGGRDAVFDVFESLFARKLADEVVEIALLGDPSVRVAGRVREVSPSVDPAAGTVRVRIGLDPNGPMLPLGAAVTGTARFKDRPIVALPWSALSSRSEKPAVWVVDPQTSTVSPRTVLLEGYGTGQIFVREGLKPGEVVVTAGAQLLRPNQTVAVAKEAAR
jgi:RND family efflux transporter MFP subunit